MAQNQNPDPANPWRPIIWGIALLALITPWVAMQFTSEVNWQAGDFIVFGLMLLTACGAYELGARLSKEKPYRLAVGITVAGSFLLTWMNLAVGILGNEGNPANLAFFIIPCVGLVGAIIARFKPPGMALTLIAMAVTQALIAVVTFSLGEGHIWILTGLFVALWLVAASLFRNAG